MINTTKIAKSNLMINKAKSIIIIITIILSTTLLSAVGLTCLDWSKANKERVIKYSGTQHGVYGNMGEKKIEEIKAHADIDAVGLLNGIGIINYDDKSKVALSYVNDKSMELSSIKLEKGSMPKLKNEIALDDLALKKLGYKGRIGEKIKIKYEDYAKKGFTENEFILSGIIESNEMAKIKRIYSGIVSKEYMNSTRDMSKENFNAYITIKEETNLSGDELKLKVEDIAKDLNIPKARVLVNEDYINTLKPDMEVIMWGVVIGIIVIMSSILVIYNIFHLSVVTKVQEFGKLRAIGATKKQIKSIVLKEGIFLSMIGVPIGVLVGFLINEFVIGKIFMFEGKAFKLPMIIGVMIISLITIYISLLKPMKEASKVSIIEAVRYNGEDKNNKKSRKGYESINLNRLSCANLSRNKKRTYITVISLSLSAIIFVVISSVMNSIDAEKMTRERFSQDIKIDLDGYTYGEEDSPDTEMNILQKNNPLGENFINKLLNINGVTNIDKSKSAKCELNGYKTEYKYHDLSSVNENDLKNLEFYLEDGEINLEKLKSGEEILITQPELATEIGIKVGDKITLTLYDGDKKIKKEFKVQGITSNPSTFAMHYDAFDKMFDTDTTTTISVYTQKGEYENIKSYIESLDKNDDYIQANYIDELLKDNKLSIAVTKGIGYALVVIIGIIGFMNLINSMITSIITRKKELGMLQAIGLTDKQLVKMLNIEAMFYIGTMILSSLTLGTGIGYIAVYAFRKTGASYATYTFPLNQILIMVFSVFIAQLLLTYFISKNFNKESLIDRIRYSE
ncbi:ABC transporter permease [Paraclostridium tenue]|uniref:FtsX-like permease family protein n=1 Tax=Paraclostridium tenue TaxID=1737 RepID=A0ABN1M087_9FIRM